MTTYIQELRRRLDAIVQANDHPYDVQLAIEALGIVEQLSAQTAVKTELFKNWNTCPGCKAKWKELPENSPLVKAHKEFMAKEEKALQSGIGLLDGRPNEQNSLSDAALVLVDKLDAIHADPEYQSVWVMSANRGAPYTGPQYTEELKSLKAAIAAQRQDSDKDAERLAFVLEHGNPMRCHDGTEQYRYFGVSPIVWYGTKIEAIDRAIANGAPK